MILQLYMWSGARALILSRHEFYVAQVKQRVLAQFNDVAGEAERFANEEFARLSAILDDGRHEQADVADIAQGNAEGFYSLLSDLREQMMLGALAGLYHQWDKELREFVEAELRHHVDSPDATKIAWAANIGDVFDVLRQFGWHCRAESFYADIDACRLIVNVYKHGKGPSLSQLAKTYPEFIDDPLEGYRPAGWKDSPDHEWVAVTEAQFDRIATALGSFWTAFPKRLYFKVA